MKNREKYAEEIKNFKGDSFCEDFVQKKILKNDSCVDINCMRCKMLQSIWLEEEAEEELEVDWRKVPVDTKILVSEFENGRWHKRYFAEYKNGFVYAYDCGSTSWTNEGDLIEWRYAKLAEVEE